MNRRARCLPNAPEPAEPACPYPFSRSSNAAMSATETAKTTPYIASACAPPCDGAARRRLSRCDGLVGCGRWTHLHEAESGEACEASEIPAPPVAGGRKQLRQHRNAAVAGRLSTAPVHHRPVPTRTSEAALQSTSTPVARRRRGRKASRHPNRNATSAMPDADVLGVCSFAQQVN